MVSENEQTHTPCPAWVRHEMRERKWILNLPNHLWVTNIYSTHKASNLQDNNILCRYSLKQVKKEKKKERSKSHIEENRWTESKGLGNLPVWKFQCILMWIMGTDNPPVSELDPCKVKYTWHNRSGLHRPFQIFSQRFSIRLSSQ